MKLPTTSALEKLVSFIDDSYTGDYSAVSHDLYRALHYLHYLEEGSVGVVELRNTCFTLYQLAEHFYEVDRLKGNKRSPLVNESRSSLTADDLWCYRL